MGKKQQKSKGIALTIRPFLATFSIFHKCAKNSKKEGYSLKRGKKQEESKAIAFTFREHFSVGRCCSLIPPERKKGLNRIRQE